MLQFHSARTRMVNSGRAVDECLEAALGEGQASNCGLIIINATMGHDFQALIDRARHLAPGAGAGRGGTAWKECVQYS
jgi:hypothetical protein